MRFLQVLLVGQLLSVGASCAAEFAVVEKNDRLVITRGSEPVAEYVWRDDKILRPYFANLHAPGRVQVTRNHPPLAGKDADDHATMHPGVWLAFGDISGEDFWRNKGLIKHIRFIQPPEIAADRLSFATENQLQTSSGRTLCTQRSDFTLIALPHASLLVWATTFTAGEQDVFFGDQEEMGLGVRVASAITEKNGGTILSSSGTKDAQATWGKSFEWCDYSGQVGNQRAGVALMTHPSNFRPSWFHNRDYGLMVANPFGRQSMKQGEVSRVALRRGEPLRLCFGALLHSSPAESLDLSAAYRAFVAAGNASGK